MDFHRCSTQNRGTSTKSHGGDSMVARLEIVLFAPITSGRL